MFSVATWRSQMARIRVGIRVVFILTILILTNYCLTFSFYFRYDTFTCLDKTMFEPLDWHYFFDANKASPYFAPIQNVLFFLMHRLFGLEPFWYHLSMLTIHILNAYLVYCFTIRILRNNTQAFLASWLFGIFPAHIDAVVYIAAIQHTLVTTFVLLSLISFTRFLHTNRRRHFSLTLIFFVLGLLTKQIAVVVPFLCAGYEYLALGNRISKSNLKKYVPVFIIGVVYLLINGAVNRANTAYAPIHAKYYKIGPHVVANYVEYIKYMAFPFNRIVSFIEKQFFSGIQNIYLYLQNLLFFIFIALVAYHVAKQREVRFPFFWVLAALLPILPFVFPPQTRYIYLPSVGFCVMLGVILTNIAANTRLYRAAVLTILITYFIVNFLNMYSLAGDYERWRRWTGEIKSHFPSLPANSKLYLIDFPQLTISRDDEISSAIRVVLKNPSLEIHALSLEEYSRVESDIASYALRYENGHFHKWPGKTMYPFPFAGSNTPRPLMWSMVKRPLTETARDGRP